MTRTATFVTTPLRRPTRRPGRPRLRTEITFPTASAAARVPDLAEAPHEPTRRRLGQALAERLWSAEQAVDAALGEAAALIALLPRARREAALAATVAQPAFAAAADSVAALARARGDLVETHRTLAALARRLGVEPVAAGPMDKPKDDRPGPGYGGG
ncbi:MAG TPA: hypothetical protein VGN74_01930 [Brevundimonas sp.]|jgi:hypothetical protein|uniref:hypothetical protein n=1 Tax=Brevundimonas sp. TaxID=1871086 RepID=UPI002E0DC94C|nr:hypothetical protein [Brevundimonas sp.]